MADYDPPQDVWEKNKGETGPGRLEQWREDFLKELLAFDEQPFTLIVDSGRGFQVGYELTFMATEQRVVEEAAYAVARLMGDETADGCHDISRIFRLWDTRNAKTGNMARLIHYDPLLKYNIADLPSMPIPAGLSGVAVDVDAERENLTLDAALEKYFPTEGYLAYVIREGQAPENEKQYPSRSEALCAVIAMLVRLKVPDGVILGLITDENNGISHSVRFSKLKGRFRKIYHPEKEARRQLGKIKGKIIAQMQEATGNDNVARIIKGSEPHKTAKLFKQDRHPHLIRYQEEFLTYRNGCYVALTEDTIRSQLTAWMDTCVENVKEGEAFVTRKVNPSPKLVNNVLPMLKDVAHVPAEMFEMPCWAEGHDDPDFPPECVVACANGLLNVRTGKMRPLTHNFLSRNAIPCAYDPAAVAPAWVKAMGQWFPDRAEDAALLQEYAGLGLIQDMSFHKFLWLWGPSRSGKSTIVRVLSELYGRHNVASPSMSSISKDFGLEGFIGKLMAFFTDARSHFGENSATETVLRVVGEDSVDINRKGIKGITNVKLRSRMWFQSNEPPSFPDNTGTIAKRALVVQMTRSFYGVEDRGLEDRILTELPGVLAWAVAGVQRLLARGRFAPSAAVLAAEREMERTSSSFQAWLAERCVLAPEHWSGTRALYHDYRVWCADNGHHPVASNKFGGLLSVLPGAERTRQTVAGRQEYGYAMVGLLPPEVEAHLVR